MNKEATNITDISPELKTFLKAHIHSVWQLELITFLRNQENPVTVSEIAKYLYSTPAAIESTLERFVQLGIIAESLGNPNSFTFSPSSMEMRQTIDDAANAYSMRRIDVINLIFSNPQRAPRLSLE